MAQALCRQQTDVADPFLPLKDSVSAAGKSDRMGSPPLSANRNRAKVTACLGKLGKAGGHKTHPDDTHLSTRFPGL